MSSFISWSRCFLGTKNLCFLQIEVEKAIGVSPPETISIHPMRPLYDACRLMIKSRARRVPLIDVDDETQQEMVLSVVTQYRILKFVAVNVKETQMLRKPLRDLDIGCRKDLVFAHMETPVIDVIHLLVKNDIASVPIVDSHGMYLRSSRKDMILYD